MHIRNSLGATLVAVLLLASTGCNAKSPAAATANRLLGTWYDSQTGAQYSFASDNLLVVPTVQPGNGNAVRYELLGSDRLDIIVGESHRVSNIETLTAQHLTLADPISGHLQPLVRDAGSTRYATTLLSGAMRRLSEVASSSASPDIVWVARTPTGAGSEWTAWSPSTLDVYLQSWDWSGLKKAAAPITTTGGGQTMAYAFSVSRRVQSETSLTASWTDKSVEATAGLPIIDVGYSATKAQYPAGTLVALSGGMIYSLGDGYAIAVGRDEKAKAFVPITHR